MGRIRGILPVNKFGRATDVNMAETDVWDRANAIDVQNIWVPPTVAQVHNIVSDSVADTRSTGDCARTVRVFGLPSWEAPEIHEDVELNGTTPEPTANKYVIVHRIMVKTAGATGPNAGTITATADIDDTVTAQVQPLAGSTQMAIYGVPRRKVLLLSNLYSSVHKAAGPGAVDFELAVNRTPDTNLNLFLVEHSLGGTTTGSSSAPRKFDPPKRFDGPCLIKLRSTGSANNLDVSGGFDGYLHDIS